VLRIIFASTGRHPCLYPTTDISAEAHANGLERIFQQLGGAGMTQEIINLMKKSA
jgi:hypothetical protein